MLVLNTIARRTRAGGGERLRPNATPSINSAYLMDAVASDDVIDEAYAWLCQRRPEAPFWHDVWHLRWQWDERKPRIREYLLDGTYRLERTRTVRFDDGTSELWAAGDALVRTAVSLVLGRFLPDRLADGCTNWKGRGGLKADERAICNALPENSVTSGGSRGGGRCVYRSEVRKGYASLRPDIVLDAVGRHVHDQRLLDLLERYLYRLVDERGEYRHVQRGIPRGCPLSAILGALCLTDLTGEIGRRGLFCGRYMDDWIVLALTRWKLRRAVRRIREIIAGCGLELAPDKTFVGRVERGCDFLGYHFASEGVGVAEETVGNFLDRKERLEAQQAGPRRINEYVTRWLRWVRAGLRFDVGELADGLGRFLRCWGAVTGRMVLPLLTERYDGLYYGVPGFMSNTRACTVLGYTLDCGWVGRGWLLIDQAMTPCWRYTSPTWAKGGRHHPPKRRPRTRLPPRLRGGHLTHGKKSSILAPNAASEATDASKVSRLDARGTGERQRGGCSHSLGTGTDPRTTILSASGRLTS